MRNWFNNIINFYYSLFSWIIGYRVPFWFFLTDENFEQYCKEKGINSDDLYYDFDTKLKFFISVKKTRSSKRRERRHKMRKYLVFVVCPFISEDKYARFETWEKDLRQKYYMLNRNLSNKIHILSKLKNFE